MGSLSTQRLPRRIVPGKIATDDCNGENASDYKENIVGGSLYSLYESRPDRLKIPSKADPALAGEAKGKSNVLKPRKRAHNEQTVPSVGQARELTPPELTTSDSFKPAKRILGPNHTEGLKQLPKIKTPRALTNESCDVLVSSPSDVKKQETPELKHSKVVPLERRDSAGRTPTRGRRLSGVRVSIVREPGGFLHTKKDVMSSAKKCTSIPEHSNGVQAVMDGKDMVFSAKKRNSLSERSNVVQVEVERARLKASERKSGLTTPVKKKGVGKFGGRPNLLETDVSDQVHASALQTNSASKAESIRTRKLSMVLKSEQRLVEKNEQYGLQLRYLQAQIEEKDHEVERLRSAGLILNNLVNTQTEEIRELRFRLKETFNENAEVRNVCEKLERELRQTRESLKLARMQPQSTRSCETRMASLTSQLQSMGIVMVEPTTRMPCIEEGQELVRVLPAVVEPSGIRVPDILSNEITSNEELLQVRNDGEQYTLQDLVMEEEDLLKERCANALRELNLPLTHLLTAKGSLDVDSLKATLASISSREDYQTMDRISSIRKLSAWIGSS